MRLRVACLIVLTVLGSSGCRTPQSSVPAWSTSPSGLGILEIDPGEGSSPHLGQTCVVHVMGWIEERGTKGQVFMDTRKRGFPNLFPLGVGRVIKGWEEGLATMKKGGKRLLRVPPSLGYSHNELGEDIPPGAILIFELELIDIR